LLHGRLSSTARAGSQLAKPKADAWGTSPPGIGATSVSLARARQTGARHVEHWTPALGAVLATSRSTFLVAPHTSPLAYPWSKWHAREHKRRRWIPTETVCVVDKLQ
jgi:hypothetical protein